jgi:hypothetical protein
LSGGLTSYPRTGGGGGSSLAAIHRLLGRLHTGSQASNDTHAMQLLDALERFRTEQSNQGTHESTIVQAILIRDALFAARALGRVSRAHHQRAMEICAEEFKAKTPFASTGFMQRSQNAILAASQPNITPATLRGLKEEIGLVAWLYEASAMLGVDLSTTVAANTKTLHARWEVASRSNGDLAYLETGASYNVNVVIRIEVPGSPGPLVIAGEAKGGHSTYGIVQGSPIMRAELKVTSPISQRSLDYARSRAWYMRRDMGTAPYQVERRKGGIMIEEAAKSRRLVFMAARGDIVAAQTQSTSRDYLECN